MGAGRGSWGGAREPVNVEEAAWSCELVVGSAPSERVPGLRSAPRERSAKASRQRAAPSPWDRGEESASSLCDSPEVNSPP